MKTNKAVSLWLWSGAIGIILMILIGGITRLTQSGLSITEWRPIVGTLPPLSEADWVLEFEKYQATPEYRLKNANMELEGFKKIFFWEYVHRLWGRLLGLLFVFPLAWFVIKKKVSRADLFPFAGLFVLGGLQGYVGWYMVQSGLVDVPHVSHFRLAIHFVMALSLLAFVIHLALQRSDIRFDSQISLKALWSVSALVFVQIVYGAFTAGLKAGYLYPQFPKMGANWIPSEWNMLNGFWQNISSNPYTVQFIHRWMGMLILVVVLVMLWQQWKERAQLSLAMKVLAGIISVQVLLGILTLILHMPLTLAVTHQMVAVFVFSVLVGMLSMHYITNKQT